jgi:hypothetical protein
MSLGSPLAAFINTPSDAMMLFVLGGCSLFYLWVLQKGSQQADEGRGCAFLVQGFLAVVVLLTLGFVLVSVFQALHPGR